MLDRPKWYHYETKSPAQVQIAHVSLNERHVATDFGRLGFQSRLATAKHTRRAVGSGDLLTEPGRGNKNSPGSAAELENVSVDRSRFLDVEINVGARSIEGHAIVELGDSFHFVTAICGLAHPAK